MKNLELFHLRTNIVCINFSDRNSSILQFSYKFIQWRHHRGTGTGGARCSLDWGTYPPKSQKLSSIFKEKWHKISWVYLKIETFMWKSLPHPTSVGFFRAFRYLKYLKIIHCFDDPFSCCSLINFMSRFRFLVLWSMKFFALLIWGV